VDADDVAGCQQLIVAGDFEAVDLGRAVGEDDVADLGLESQAARLLGAGPADASEAEDAEGLVDELVDGCGRIQVQGGTASLPVEGR